MEGLAGVESLNDGGWAQCNHGWCCDHRYGCKGAMGVVIMVLSLLLTARVIALFTALLVGGHGTVGLLCLGVQGWFWCMRGLLELCSFV